MDNSPHLAQIVSWIASTIFWLASTLFLGKSVAQYRESVRQRAAEALMKLEERLATLSDITWVIDPESKMYGRPNDLLASAVKKSLHGQQMQRTPDEDEKGKRLDQFLRFLLLVSRVEKDKLLNLEALKYMYHYWFETVAYAHQYDLRCYVKLYFKNLNAFLDQEFPLRDEQKAEFEQRCPRRGQPGAPQVASQ